MSCRDQADQFADRARNQPAAGTDAGRVAE